MSAGMPSQRQVEALFASCGVLPGTRKFTITIVTTARDEMITVELDGPSVALINAESAIYVRDSLIAAERNK
jgi:hypothetical protein